MKSKGSIPELSQLTLEQKIGQLIFTRAGMADIERSIETGKIGGVFINPTTSPDRLRQLQEYAAIPLMSAMDLEVGYFNGSTSWPMAMSCAAAGGVEFARRWAAAQAIEARAAGICGVFGPVFDVAMNPDGQCVGPRSFGDDAAKVAKYAVAAIRGYQENGVLPFAKHFPGFGRGMEDAHIEMSNLSAKLPTMMRQDLLPYIAAIKQAALGGVMTGHIWAKAIDAKQPCPISPKFIALLRKLGFTGITVTDSLAMKAIKYVLPPEELYPAVIAAGHDMLLTDYDLPDADGFGFILKAVRRGKIPMATIDRAVGNILAVKRRLLTGARPRVDRPAHEKLWREISRKSMTALTPRGKFAPLKKGLRRMFVIISAEAKADDKEFATSNSGTAKLAGELKKKFPGSTIRIVPEYPASGMVQDVLLEGIGYDDICVVMMTFTGAYRGTNHFTRPALALVRGMATRIGTIVICGNPFAAEGLPENVQKLFAYSGGPWLESVMDVLTGKLTPKGKLPVKINK